MIDWNQLRLKYIQNAELSLRSIAEEAGVSLTHVKRKASAEGWSVEKKEYHEQVHQNATRKLLTSTADEAATQLVERSVVRSKNWRIVQASAMALIANLELIQPSTGLPKKMLYKEIGEAGKALKDAVTALEKASEGERLESGLNSNDEVLQKSFMQYQEQMQELSNKTPQELRDEADKIRKRLNRY